MIMIKSGIWKAAIRRLTFLLFLLLSVIFLTGHYSSIRAEELSAPSGKVIVGMTRSQAAARFGNPDLSTDDFWYYLKPEPFFVYFSGDVPVALYLYPEFFEASLGETTELRVFGYSADFTLRDISGEVEFLFDHPEDFVRSKPGLFIPLKPGEHQVLAKYNDVFSNPAYITVKKAGSVEEEYEKLVAIDILPFKPRVPPGNSIDFVALGTFIVAPEGRYVVKDISQKARWFIQDERSITPLGDRRIYFASAGSYSVFCKYQNTQSYPQEVSVRVLNAPMEERLKHITLIPEFIAAPTLRRVSIRAFGTYLNNRIDDITDRVSWNTSDHQIASPVGSGEFSTGLLRGVAEITASLKGIRSLPVKLVVSIPEGDSSFKEKEWEEEPSPSTSPEASQDKAGGQEDHSKREGAGPDKNIFGQARKLLQLKITPEYLTIPFGGEASARAIGIYSDNSQDDLTTLCAWVTSDSKVAEVDKGKVNAISSGEAKITAEFRGKVSLPMQVTVGEAGLVSIVVSPRDSRISMEDKVKLKAEGHFTDSSRRDITALVSWKADKAGIVRITAGNVRPLKLGRVIIHAEYLKTKSLPVSVRVILTLKWLLLLLLKFLLFFLLLLSLVFMVFYSLTEVKKNRMRHLLNSNPRGFIIGLYAEARRLLAVFGIRDDTCKPQIVYALSVEKRHKIDSSLFLKFTVRFAEAKYSRHAFRPDDAQEALEEYRKFSRMIFSGYARSSLYLRLALALLKRIPVF